MPRYLDPMRGRAIVVSYDCRSTRCEKRFTNEYTARSFYRQKFLDGKNPTIKVVER